MVGCEYGKEEKKNSPLPRWYADSGTGLLCRDISLWSVGVLGKERDIEGDWLCMGFEIKYCMGEKICRVYSVHRFIYTHTEYTRREKVGECLDYFPGFKSTQPPPPPKDWTPRPASCVVSQRKKKIRRLVLFNHPLEPRPENRVFSLQTKYVGGNGVSGAHCRASLIFLPMLRTVGKVTGPEF